MAKMSSAIPIKIKHGGKLHDLTVDPSGTGLDLKATIYSLTGVAPDRQKVMIKGGLLKDEVQLSQINLKANQTLMVLGTAGELPKPPTEKITFLEDMTDKQLAQSDVNESKSGLVNLGNTCYLASTLQVLRAIPELQDALNKFQGNLGSHDPEANLTASLRDLYKSLSQTTDSVPPFAFLTLLRQVAPQFAEMARAGGGYAQQDAEEAWVRIVSALGNSLSGDTSSQEGGSSNDGKKFVQQYMTGWMSIKRSSKEAPEEEPTYQQDPFSMLQCNISGTTNEMMSGILDSLNQQIEKTSSTLNRSAIYDEVSRIDRLPKYLTTHFVRFYWRREINKKTKIMRKVKFPFVLDATPFLSEELKKKLGPATEKLREIEKEREERSKVKKKARVARDEIEKMKKMKEDEEKKEGGSSTTTSTSTNGGGEKMEIDGEEKKDETEGLSEGSKLALGSAITEEEELKLREKEKKEFEDSINDEVRKDIGANVTALYELVGVVTHKGAAADAGHYISWVRKEGKNGEETKKGEKDEQWYKLDDDRVSIVGREKIVALDGGGEDSVAYILLYRHKTLA